MTERWRKSSSGSPVVPYVAQSPPYLMSFISPENVSYIKKVVQNTDVSYCRQQKKGHSTKYFVKVPRHISPLAVRWQLKKAGLNVYPSIEENGDS